MKTEQELIEQFKEQGLMPLFYHPDISVCIDALQACYDAGVRLMEFTNRGENALQNFKVLIKTRDNQMPDLQLGAGTIKTEANATDFIEAGADFLVSPCFDSTVCDVAYFNKKLWIPGCMTPSEIHMANQAGCKLIKLFPGNLLGPAFVTAVKDVYPEVLLMPTGGVEVDEENLAAWFKSGVTAVGMGGKLISKSLLEKKDYAGIESLTRKALQIIRKIKKQDAVLL